MAGALEGVKVLDCSQIIAGPMAASLLAEMGADVVKVEPVEGEPWRLQAEIVPKESRTFHTQNRGKRGIAINFKDPATRNAREALLQWADVMIVNYRPGAAANIGLDYETVRALNPAIIYCDNTAWGTAGPDAMRRGYDAVAQAMSGLMTSIGIFRQGQPVATGLAPADVLTGAAMAFGIASALYHREKTGEGQALSTSLLLSAMYMQPQLRETTAFDREVRDQRLAHLADARARGATIEQIAEERLASMPAYAGNIYYRGYQTADSYIMVACLGPGPRARFRKATGMRDPRYEEGFDQSPENVTRVGAELTAEAEALFRTRTTAEWLAIMDANDIAAGPVRFVEELWEDPQVLENNYLISYEHSMLGEMIGPAPLVQMSGTPTRVDRGSPALGEHDDEVLREAGVPEDEIAGLREKGAIV